VLADSVVEATRSSEVELVLGTLGGQGLGATPAELMVNSLPFPPLLYCRG